MATKATKFQGGDGTAIEAGMVGEKITFTSRTVTGSSGAWAANATKLATLTPGVWRIVGRMSGFTQNNSASVLSGAVATNSTADGTGLISQTIIAYNAVTGGANNSAYPLTELDIVVTASSQDLFGKCYGEDAAVNVAIDGFAIRIA